MELHEGNIGDVVRYLNDNFTSTIRNIDKNNVIIHSQQRGSTTENIRDMEFADIVIYKYSGMVLRGTGKAKEYLGNCSGTLRLPNRKAISKKDKALKVASLNSIYSANYGKDNCVLLDWAKVE